MDSLSCNLPERKAKARDVLPQIDAGNTGQIRGARIPGFCLIFLMFIFMQFSFLSYKFYPELAFIEGFYSGPQIIIVILVMLVFSYHMKPNDS